MRPRKFTLPGKTVYYVKTKASVQHFPDECKLYIQRDETPGIYIQFIVHDHTC